jgi:hypothetical protein
MKLIEFNPATEYANLTNLAPISAKKALPKFFLEHKTHIGNTQLNSSGHTTSTVKRCMPFLDSMTTGYVLRLEQDIEVQDLDNEKVIVWQSGGEIIGIHAPEQIPSKFIPDEFYKIPFKFGNHWSVKTPKGWSLIICHPLNRTDLPFQIFSGVVESDKYASPIALPFIIKKNFSGIIPMGTPIAQLIPIKRTPWLSKIGSKIDLKSKKQLDAIKSYIKNGYKNLIWEKKSYL